MPFATTNPVNGEIVCGFPSLSDRDVEDTVDAADSAYAQWCDTELPFRASVLLNVAKEFRLHSRELAKLSTLEIGKPVTQALAEVELSACIFEYYSSTGPSLVADEQIAVTGDGSAIVRSVPIGPLLGIMPSNFPYYQVARFVAPNLLLGNAILLKHAPNCPQQAARLAQLFSDAGVPEGVYQNLFIEPAQALSIIDDSRVRGVSLTGSERAGKAVGAAAGGNLKKSVLELGGSDPFIVLPGADIDKTVAMAVSGRFWNAGQTCTSSKRFIVDSSMWEMFVSRFVVVAGTWPVGDPNDENTKLGPMSSVSGRDTIAAQVEDAVRAGATVHLGAETPSGPGAYYPATVLSNVTSDMRAYHEELFGPVAVLYRVDSVDEAVALANDTAFGLGSAVFTDDLLLADSIANRLDVGMVGINTIVRSSPELPFGGVKSSGIGRELGRFGVDEFANKKLIRTLI